MKIIVIGVVVAILIQCLNVALLVGIARLFRAEKVTWLRAALTVVCQIALNVAGLLLLATATDLSVAVPLFLLILGGYCAVSVWCIHRFMALSRKRAIGTFLVHAMAASAMGVAVVLPVRFLVAEGFSVPTNSMAPTLLGRHRLGECPHCQRDLILPGLSESEGYDSGQLTSVPQPGICLQCRQESEAMPTDMTVHDGDRFMVDKTTSYRRFDLVVYYPAAGAKTLYVKRLVALPGETLELRSGALWVNGQALQYPPDMKGLKFEPAREGRYQEYSLAEGTTLTLGDDELFLLGDHSQGSFDSRYTGPVPTSAIVGVVTWIYWPLSRSRIVR